MDRSAYRYTDTRQGNRWRYEHRGELELTTRFNLAAALGLAVRGRLEARAREKAGSGHERLRLRVRLSRRLSPSSRWQTVALDNEVFHDVDRGMIVENRWTPLRVELRLKPQTQLALSGTLRSLRGNRDWRHQWILGTSLSFVR